MLAIYHIHKIPVDIYPDKYRNKCHSVKKEQVFLKSFCLTLMVAAGKILLQWQNTILRQLKNHTVSEKSFQ